MRTILAAACLLGANLIANAFEAAAPAVVDEEPELYQPSAPTPWFDWRDLTSFTSMLDPIQIDNMTVVPLVHREVTIGTGAFIDATSLADALRSSKISIRERPDGSIEGVDQPSNGPAVVILEGEVLHGERMNCTAVRSTVEFPHPNGNPLDMRCTPHDHRRAGWQLSDSLAERRGWRTDRERELFASRLERAAAAIDSLSDDERARMVGFAVAFDGEVFAIDTFVNQRLFRDYADQLLWKAIYESLDHGPAEPSPCSSAFRAFLYDVDLSAENRRSAREACSQPALIAPIRVLYPGYKGYPSWFYSGATFRARH